MQDFRFRAWHSGSNRMIESRKQGYQGNAFKWLAEGQPVEIMQYTGLKDKNGNPIYESDILLVPEGFYGENAMKARKEHKEIVEHDVCDSDCDGSGYWLNLPDSVKWSDCEIVGNIYENPELVGL